jgi:hypothetical protein
MLSDSSTLLLVRTPSGTSGECYPEHLSDLELKLTPSYRYIYVFVGWDVIESAAWYFFG